MSSLDPTGPVRDAAVNTIADKVGNLVGTLWDYSLGLVVNIIFLSRKADEIAGEIEKLEARRKDLEYQAEEDEASMPSNELNRWMGEVTALAKVASKFQESFGDRSFCITRLRLGYEAVELLRQAKELTEEGRDFPPVPLSRRRGPDPVQQVPSETSSSTLVGGEGALRQVDSYIMDDGVGIIGIYGMGGVGKTTLLKIINNEFLHGEAECRDKFHGEACRHKFEVVIWVTVSRDVQISTIQKSIADRLGLKWPLDAPKDKLFDKLSKKRFVLLLDDVWEKLDLVEIGIPLPKNSKNKSKILFTTRNEHVCGQMDAEKVKIDFLDNQSSWDLFRSKFGKEAALLNDTEIEKLAKEVVRRCGGLPIVLITVGRAMSSYAKAAGDWEDAITQLDECASEIPGMEEAVLKSLKFSFDKLRNEALRNGLLYCALFPEDYAIPKEEIIDYWICEGFLDDERSDEYDIERTRRRGNVLIRQLQNACLLEGAAYDDYVGEETVMLHDTVRHMALWIAGGDFGVLVGSDSNDYSLQILKLRTWESARRISLFNIREIEEEPPSPSRWTPSFPKLTTLLLPGSEFANELPKGFFTCTSMPALRVLDLKCVDFSEFPIEITSLISLQYLCLTHCGFHSLPVQLGNLTNLRHLIVRTIPWLSSIPREAISRLSRLRVLDMWGSGYHFDDDDDTRQPPQLKMSDLERTGRLRELHLSSSCSSTSLGVMLASPLLRRCTRSLCAGGPRVAQIGRLSNLEVLQIRELYLLDCDGCSDLTWVGRLPCLERLSVEGSPELREVLRLEAGGHDDLIMTSFPKLKHLHLENIPLLRSISTRPLPFPSLRTLVVFRCPQLKRLPFGPESAKNLRGIRGGQAWWDGLLEWNNHADKERFSSKFQVQYGY